MVSHSADWSLQCNGCGRCCNSPPLLSLPELFHHRRRFIGCLSVRRLPAHSTSAQRELAGQLLPGSAAAGVVLLLQGYTWPSQQRCPALGPDQLCSVHHDRKPLTCRVVPLDALTPDSEQSPLLAERAAQSEWLGADCLRPFTASATGQILLRQHRVEDTDYLAALAQRRRDLQLERQYWGDAIHAMLLPELAGTSRLPVQGYISLPLVPILAHLAVQSNALRLQCQLFLVDQLTLINSRISSAIASKNPQDRASTQELRGFADAYQRLLGHLQRDSIAKTTLSGDASLQWLLGLAEPQPGVTT